MLLRGDVHDFLLDEGLASRLVVERLNARKQPGAKLPPGLRYATEADVSDAFGDDA